MTGTCRLPRPRRATLRTLQLVCGVWTTWTLLALVQAPAAAADNCSVFTDCFGVTNSAAKAAFGLSLLAGLSLVLDFVPFVGTGKGIIEAVSGRDLITGDELAPWERALGVIPYVGKLGRVSKVIGTVDDVGKHLDDVGDVSKHLDDVGDVSKHADDVPSPPKGPTHPPVDPAGDIARDPVALNYVARTLLGNAGDVVVLGRQPQTALYKGQKGHVVLDTPLWSPELNDAFMREAVLQGRKIYLASPITGNLIQVSGPYAGQPSVFARELEILREAGYSRVGDYMLPPL